MNKNEIGRPFILIVDDTPENIQVMASLLSHEGYHLAPAVNGREALEKIELLKPDLVMLDLIMPEMSGVEVLEKISNDHRDIPVIVVTTESAPEIAAECMRMGAVDYLTKPIDTLRTLTVVRNTLKTKFLEVINSQIEAENTEIPEKPLPQEFNTFITNNKLMSNTLFSIVEAQQSGVNTFLISGSSACGKSLLAKCTLDLLRGKNILFCKANEKNSFIDLETDSSPWIIDDIHLLSEDELHKLVDILKNREERSASTVLTTLLPTEKQHVENILMPLIYDNLSTINVHMPPLIERRDDIAPLFTHFALNAATLKDQKTPELSTGILLLLKACRYKNNINDLKKIAESCIDITSWDGVIDKLKFKEIIRDI